MTRLEKLRDMMERNDPDLDEAARDALPGLLDIADRAVESLAAADSLEERERQWDALAGAINAFEGGA
jgi:hypothetical protein